MFVKGAKKILGVFMNYMAHSNKRYHTWFLNLCEVSSCIRMKEIDCEKSWYKTFVYSVYLVVSKLLQLLFKKMTTLGK